MSRGCLRLCSPLPVSYATDKSFWPENSFTSPKIAYDEEEKIGDNDYNDNDGDDDEDDNDWYNIRLMVSFPTKGKQNESKKAYAFVEKQVILKEKYNKCIYCKTI